MGRRGRGARGAAGEQARRGATRGGTRRGQVDAGNATTLKSPGIKALAKSERKDLEIVTVNLDEAKDIDAAKKALSQTVSIVDKMATKGIIHRNTAGRYKSRLASRLAKKSAAA